MALVLSMVLALLLAQVPRAYSAESTAPENALLFLADVVRLDMTKYDAKLEKVSSLPSGVGASDLVFLKYTLTSVGSKIEVICHVRNNMISWCKLYPLKGSPLFAQPATNALDAAKSFLDRYQTYSGLSHVQPMRSVLDTVSELKPMTKAVDDVRLEITTDEDRESIQWMNAVNGITNTYNVAVLSFRNGAFEFFCDEWNRYRIGSADVKVDREEAIRIAKEHAQNRIRADVGDEAALSYTFVSEHALLTMQPRENALYPHWEVLLALNKMVPSYGATFRVSVWADTGEVPYITYSGSYGGTPQSEEKPAPSPAPDQSQSHPSPSSPQSSTSSENLIAGTAAIAIAITIVVVAMKRRSKRERLEMERKVAFATVAVLLLLSLVLSPLLVATVKAYGYDYGYGPASVLHACDANPTTITELRYVYWAFNDIYNARRARARLLDGQNAGCSPSIDVYMDGPHTLQAVFAPAPSYYFVSSIDSYGGPVYYPENLVGWQNDGLFAALEGWGPYYYYGWISGAMNTQAAGHIYVYGGGYGHLYVYVSSDGWSWNYVSDQYVYQWSPYWIDCGTYLSPFNYIVFTVEDPYDYSYIELDSVRVEPPTYYNLSISSGGGGSTNPSPGVYQYAEGTPVSVTAIPDSGYVLDYWLLDGQNVGSQNPITVTMNSDHNLQANFGVGSVYHWLTVDAYDGYIGNPLYPNIYIDGNWAGYGYAHVQVTEGWHSVWVDDWVWNDYLGTYDYFSYFTDGYGNGANRPVYSDTWITAVYYPW